MPRATFSRDELEYRRKARVSLKEISNISQKKGGIRGHYHHSNPTGVFAIIGA